MQGEDAYVCGLYEAGRARLAIYGETYIRRAESSLPLGDGRPSVIDLSQ
jgi:hypothetical protein